jgi:hypothetical protein
MKNVLYLSFIALFALGATGCVSTDNQILGLQEDPTDEYCKIEETDGGVIIIRNEQAAEAATILGELPSCQLLYNTFYRYGPIDKQVKALDSKVDRLEKRVSTLEKK